MKYENITPIILTDNGVDELGNSLKSKQILKPITCKFTKWTKEDIELYGREITKNSKKVIIKRYLFNENTDKFIIDNKEFDFKLLSKGNRWIVIEVLSWK